MRGKDVESGTKFVFWVDVVFRTNLVIRSALTKWARPYWPARPVSGVTSLYGQPGSP